MELSPFDAKKKAEVVAEVNRRAAASGRTPDQELWDYGRSEGLYAKDIDLVMGFNPGTTAKWAATPPAGSTPKSPQLTTSSQAQYADPQAQPITGVAQSPAGSPQMENLGLGPGQQSQNPYLNQQAQGITSQMNDNWTRNQLPSIRSGAMAAGGFGGSRQGVVEANGLNDMNRSLGQNLTNLYGTDWTNQQNRNLQKQGLDNSYDLGLRSNDLGYANLDAGIANSNFNNQLSAANFGLGVYNTMNQQTQNGINAGTTIQNTPLDYQKYFTNSANGVGSGYSTGTSSQTNPGNPYMSAIGGAMMGNQIQYPTVKKG